VAVLALVWGTTAKAQPRLEEWLSEPFSWHGEVAPGAPITLVNEHGDLRVRGKPSEELEIVGYLQHHVDDGRKIAVEPVPSEGGWTLEVTMGSTPGEDVPADWSRRRVDLTVYVPWTSPLTVRTSDGVLEALDLRAPLVVETDSGELLAGGDGELTVKSRSGSVRVVLQEPDWSSTATIETFSGPVSVWARPDADAELTLETRGTLTTDFSLEVQRLDPSLRRAHAKLGKGTGSVRVTTYQGPLAFREIVSAVVHPAGAAEKE